MIIWIWKIEELFENTEINRNNFYEMKPRKSCFFQNKKHWNCKQFQKCIQPQKINLNFEKIVNVYKIFQPQLIEKKLILQGWLHQRIRSTNPSALLLLSIRSSQWKCLFKMQVKINCHQQWRSDSQDSSKWRLQLRKTHSCLW